MPTTHKTNCETTKQSHTRWNKYPIRSMRSSTLSTGEYTKFPTTANNQSPTSCTKNFTPCRPLYVNTQSKNYVQYNVSQLTQQSSTQQQGKAQRTEDDGSGPVWLSRRIHTAPTCSTYPPHQAQVETAACKIGAGQGPWKIGLLESHPVKMLQARRLEPKWLEP